MEQFCREFLLRHEEYNYLHEIVESYSDRYRTIDVMALFHSKEIFVERFLAIWFTIVRLRGEQKKKEEEDCQHANCLAILGFALHVHDMACKDAKLLEWYDVDIMIDTLQYILNCSNFNPIYYCKRQRNSCIIL